MSITLLGIAQTNHNNMFANTNSAITGSVHDGV